MKETWLCTVYQFEVLTNIIFLNKLGTKLEPFSDESDKKGIQRGRCHTCVRRADRKKLGWSAVLVNSGLVENSAQRNSLFSAGKITVFRYFKYCLSLIVAALL
jgi:hypothetical protein